MKILQAANKLLRKTLKQVFYWRMYRWFSIIEKDLASYLEFIDRALWIETKEYADMLTRIGTEELKSRSITVGLPDQGVGGGAEWALLYFLVRQRKPATVVETGVAMGWSSRAILDAMEINGLGHLYSTDLPYSYRPGREDVGVNEADVGCLVPQNMRERWTLFLGPDREHLPTILSKTNGIDIFHYDSDKSYEGRQWAMEQVQGKMSQHSIILMDDIKDNSYFMDFAKSTTKPWRILREKTSQRWVGMIDL